MIHLLVLLIVLWALPAWGATYYTSDASGSNSNGCNADIAPTNMGLAKKTIGAGIGCLGPGDTLLIREGLYPETMISYPPQSFHWPSGTPGNPITIAGYPGETATIKPAAPVGPNNVLLTEDNGAYTDSHYIEYLIFDNLVVDGSNLPHVGTVIVFDVGSRYITLQNSKIIGSRIRGGDGFGGTVGVSGGADPMGPITTFAGPFVIRNNEITGHGIYGLYIGAGGHVFENNYIHDIDGYAIHLYSGEAPGDCTPGVNCHITSDNIIRNNVLIGSGLHYPQGTCAMILSSGMNNLAYNNVVVGNANGCGIQISSTQDDGKVYNNTIVGNAGFCMHNEPSSDGTIIRNNICYNNGADIVNEGRGAMISNNTNNSINPLFAQ
jgi:hypothetical protein